MDIDIGGRTVSVDVRPAGEVGAGGGRFQVTLRTPREDGRVDVEIVDLDARPTELGVSVVYLSDGRSVDAALTSGAAGAVLVQLPAVDVDLLIDNRRRRAGSPGAGAASGELRVSAPMPGRVVRVLVRPGDEVTVRQPLVVIEAMKMENELVAPGNGRVVEVHVADGASVEAGRVLIVVAGPDEGLR
jgi:biotin carboxyl carrier protein